MKVPQALAASNNEIAAIMGQSRVNQLGGHYINGKPLPTEMRVAIVRMHNHGIKPCVISRKLKISHGAVSKILNRYQETGSVAPGQIGGNQRHRVSAQSLDRHILRIKEERPQCTALDVQGALVEAGFCTRANVPTVNSIRRHMQARGMAAAGADAMLEAKSDELTSPSTSDKQLNHSIEHILGHRSDARTTSPDSSTATSTARSRTNFTTEQIDALERAYARNSYPTPEEKEDISRETGLNQEKIGVWFSNRRARLRKTLAGHHAPAAAAPAAPALNPHAFQQLLHMNMLMQMARQAHPCAASPPGLPPLLGLGPFLPAGPTHEREPSSHSSASSTPECDVKPPFLPLASPFTVMPMLPFAFNANNMV